ncbi:MAG: hypothetical protein ACJAWV_000071 [Flammeovirgaceae bacterium]|jgi:uncharacterized protein YigE (DUF2233 family)
MNSKFLFLLLIAFSCQRKSDAKIDLKTLADSSKIASHVVNLEKQELRFFWKDKQDSIYNTFQNLKTKLSQNGEKLVFAMNGGMFNKDFSPQGLYIENGELLSELDTQQIGYGNFYLQPNGIFWISNQNKAFVSTTSKFSLDNSIKFATQSGPMLLINGEIHPKLINGSKNLHIRNGVGVLPDGQVLFAISKEPINFYDFASFFKEKGCQNALYLDGFVSKMYLPSKGWSQLNSKFGVIIAETEK